MNRKVTVSNSKFMFFIITLVIIGASVKLGFVALETTVDGVNIKAYAESRNTSTTTLLASRGDILDIYGSALAQTVNSYTLIAYLSEGRTTSESNIRHVVDIEGTAKALAETLDLDYKYLVEQLSKDKYQVEIMRDLTELTKSKIDALELDGIGYSESNTRYYPNGTFVSYLIGYAKKGDDEKIVGELGIEGYYNSLLTGSDGSTTYQKDAHGYTIPNAPVYTEEPEDGADIYLTIDSNIQLILENAIKKINDVEHEWGIITVMDANTGAIVGSASSPSFNPNDLNTIRDNYLNPLVSYQFEPGSTMKTFSFAAAIEEGLYDGNAKFSSGSIVVGDATIKDYNKVGWGNITYDVGYAYSSNVATTKIALDLGVGKLTDYYTDLGFSKKTGIELSNEYAGYMNMKYSVELANAAFGQGISVTPIQMLQAYTTMTNNGVMLQPYIVDKIVSQTGDVIYQSEVTEVKEVFSPETVDYMHKLMTMAVYEGTNSYYIPSNVDIMGKTGTAQIASGGAYLSGTYDYIRSFAAIFPTEEPKYIYYIITSKYEDSVSKFAEVSTAAIEEIASYANITNHENEYIVNEGFILDNYISKKTEEVIENFDEKNMNVQVIGNGNYIIDQFPNKKSVVFEDDIVFLLTNDTKFTMPDITGYSSSDLKTFCTMVNLECNINGTGYVTKQSIKVGTTLKNTHVLEVTLK
ncbi:MAG: penicillin-binding protein [bacterium]